MFRKSSYSQGVSNCAEVGDNGDLVLVRDTKEKHLGEDRTVLNFRADTWTRFIGGLKES